jgi:HAD superfamily hydrolase (TIGR01509 family)
LIALEFFIFIFHGSSASRDVIVSGRVGLLKPDAEIFTVAMERWNVNPADCIFIDDTPDNIEAARHFGIEAVLYDDDKVANVTAAVVEALFRR